MGKDKQLQRSYLSPVRYDESGTMVHDLAKVMPGTTLITGHWLETNWRPGLRLIDVNGNTLNHWDVNIEEIWPESPHTDFTQNSKNVNWNNVHGSYLYPNGDVVFNINGLSLIRMNSCGEVLWKLPFRTHHSFDVDAEGDLWVPAVNWVEEGNERAEAFPGLEVPFREDTILEVSPSGEVLREIGFLESIYNGGYLRYLWQYGIPRLDIMHVNDVEILGEELADQFPLFEGGDILVSSRRLNLVAVMGPTGDIKWISVGDFTQQHDPDFEADGWITIFDNQRDLPNPDSDIGASMIKSVNPATGETKDIYPRDGESQFYTSVGGKHQKRANGNRLITEALAGRVFEVTSRVETVWEWISEPFDEKDVPEVFEGTRYDVDAEQVSTWQCSGPP